MAQDRGLLSVYKSMGTFVPLTSARAVAATPAAGLGEAEEDKTQRLPRQILEAHGAEGELDHTWQHPCRDDLHSASKPITLGAESSDTIDNVKTKIWKAHA